MCSATWVHPTHGPIKCGQCMECRLAYSREWAIRISNEAQMHERNSFLTLTYSGRDVASSWSVGEARSTVVF